VNLELTLTHLARQQGQEGPDIPPSLEGRTMGQTPVGYVMPRTGKVPARFGIPFHDTMKTLGPAGGRCSGQKKPPEAARDRGAG